MVGTPVAGYTIKKEVGEGGTSAVYLAEHPNHARREMIVRITKVVRQNPAYRPSANDVQQPPILVIGGCSFIRISPTGNS